MNSVERNCGNAIIGVLNLDAGLAALPPTLWDFEGDLPFPRAVVKCTQGEELVYRCGVYRIACEINVEASAKDALVDELKAIISQLILDNQAAPVLPSTLQPVHVLMTTAHFHCFAVEPGGVSVNNININRVMSVSFNAVGFDLDRHA